MSRRASGLRAWLLQRSTAVYLGLFCLFLVLHFLLEPPTGVEQWRAWVGQPWPATGLMMFCAALLLHAWVGLRDVLIDYVRLSAMRIVLLGLAGAGLIACGLWFLQVILHVRSA